MLRGPALLLRLTQRVPLARAVVPLLVAYAPEACGGARTHSLHVFARRPNANHTKVEVRDGADAGDLKDAVCAKLKLDAPPDSVSLLREVEGGGAPVPLDSRRALAEQGVHEGSVLIEVAGSGAPVPLDNCEVLASQGVVQGSWQHRQQQQQPPPCPLPAVEPPAPLTFAREDVGGTPMMVADLAPPCAPVPLPFFLTLREHGELQAFLAAHPARALLPRALATPSMLMVTGTTKSGKTRILHHVIPRMLAEEHAAAARTPLPRRRPAVFAYTFPLQLPAHQCAQHLVRALQDFGRAQGCPLPPAHSEQPLHDLPCMAAALAQHLQARGEELWLLLDELGAPIVASTPADARSFTLALKDTLAACWGAGGCMAGSGGSGMLSLLGAMRVAAPNGFALWDTVRHVKVGGQPRTPAAALAMARRLHAFYTSDWPTAVAAGAGEAPVPPALASVLSPERCVAGLAVGAHGGATSPRPALVAYLLELTLSGTRGAGSSGGDGEGLWRSALDWLMLKLRTESVQDAAVALERLSVPALRLLRQVADGRVSRDLLPHSLDRGFSASSRAQANALEVLLLLCEEGEEGGAGVAGGGALELMPPFGALLRGWITRAGLLAVSSEDGALGLHALTRSNLKALNTLQPRFSGALRSAMSQAVLRSLLSNGIGTEEAFGESAAGGVGGEAGGRGSSSSSSSGLRVPRTVEEFVAIPAIAHVMAALEEEAAQQGEGCSAPSVERLRALLLTPQHSQARQEFMLDAGLRALMLVRHAEMHAPHFPSGEIVRGLACTVIVEAVNAAIESPLALEDGFVLKQGVLHAGPDAAGRRSSSTAAATGKKGRRRAQNRHHKV